MRQYATEVRKMKYGYDLEKEKGIFLNEVSLFEYRKQGFTKDQRRLITEANPHLFDKRSIPVPGSDESAYISLTPPSILFESGLIMDEQSKTYLANFKLKGIAKEFSKLDPNNSDSIVKFANSYGLLGCKLVEQTQVLNSPKDYIKKYFSYHHSYFEPLKVWEWHIDHVKKLFQLYRALRYKQQIENTILRVEILPKNEDDVPMPNFGIVYWNDGKLFDYYHGTSSRSEEIDYSKLARGILVNQLSNMLKGAIDLSYDTIEDDDKSELGFKMNETRETPFLLAAIYYDLWDTIKNRQTDSDCDYCGASYTPSKRTAMYCSSACKQAAYRKNKGVNNNG
jgi:hypothetical protein